MSTNFTISNVTERDIDLLLLEEFVVSPSFASWFAELTAGLTLGDNAVCYAQRSVTSTFGESDLIIAMTIGDDLVHYLLIENKVAASFQPRQADRYLERGEEHKSRGECVAFTTVLVAPEQYFGVPQSMHGFHAVVSYEAIQDWFNSSEGSDPRATFKRTLLAAAINKSSTGYQKVENAPVTEFWQSYWQLAQTIAPQLEMQNPGTKPVGAGHLYFRPSQLSSGVSLVHKLGQGCVDLQFPGMGANLTTLREKSGRFLEPGMYIEQAGKSGALRRRVSVVNATLDFDAQAEQVQEGIDAARTLLDWCIRNSRFIESVIR